MGQEAPQLSKSEESYSPEVLIVEDDPRVVELLQITLRGSGFSTRAVLTGEDAVKELSERRADLVILDVHLPMRSGFETCREIREAPWGKNLPIVMLSGDTEIESRVKGLSVGADDYVVKPFSPRELVLRIRKMLERADRTRALVRAAVRMEDEVRKNQQGLGKVNKELKLQLYRKEMLVSLSQKLNSSLKLDQLLDTFLWSAIGQFGLNYSCLMLGEEKTRRYVVYASKGLKDGTGKSLSFPVDGALANTLMKNGRPVFVAELEQYRELEREVGELYAAGAQVLSPVIVRGKLLAILVAGERLNGRPFSREDVETLTWLSNSAGVAIDNAKLYEELEQTYLATIRALISTIEARDPYTKGHTERVAEYSVCIAEAMNLPQNEIQDVRFGAALHDIGKLGVERSVLNKPGELDASEWEVIRNHPLAGAKILKGIKFLERALDIVLHHHERFDGTGYPDGLRGAECSLGARIVAVADSFDAMTCDRPYRRALGVREALAQVEKMAGKQFDPQVVEVFLREITRGNIRIG